MSHARDVTSLVARLVEIHGEGGVAPRAADWHAIFRVGRDGPIHLLNLLKFVPKVAFPEGPVPGATAYRRYTAGTAGAFARVGAERIFLGRVGHQFASAGPGDWDLAVLVRYPSAGALAEMWLDPEFLAAHEHRVEGVERSHVLVFEG